MIVDLHNHYPMHLLPRREKSMMRIAVRRDAHWSQSTRFRAIVLAIANQLANYRNIFAGSRITAPKLHDGGVGVALSVLYSPFDEVDLSQKYPGTPLNDYRTNVLTQRTTVENDINNNHSGIAQVVHNPAELDAALNAGKVAFVHCIEGGFQIGAQPGAEADAVCELAQAGVAYITVAHLFYRKVATNANAIPHIPNRIYDHFWRQPDVGLTPVGQAVIEAMVDEGVLIDVTHMDQDALDATFTLLEEIEDEKKLAPNSIPVIASHGAIRLDGRAYNLSPDTIRTIRDRDGVIGLILSEKLMTPGTRISRTRNLEDSLQVVFRHINEIRDLCNGSYRHIGIGTDLDGFIKPTLADLGDASELRRLEQGLIAEYDPDIAKLITSDNALRVLRDHWRGATPDADAATA